MKTLRLLRHAKSSWDDPDLADIDRPLNKRGRQACKMMAHALNGEELPVNAMYCSPAQRTQQTLQRLSKHLQQPLEWRTTAALYTFDAEKLLHFCQTLPESEADVLLVGHNPAFTALINRIATPPIDNLATCGYVCVELPIAHWRQLGEQRGTVRRWLYPKLFA